MIQSANFSPLAVKRWPGWWYLFIYISVFGVVLIVNLFFMFSAVHSFSGLSTDQAYDKGLKYNQEIAAAKQQQLLGWTVTADVLANELSAKTPPQRRHHR